MVAACKYQLSSANYRLQLGFDEGLEAITSP
jgi:hypothetical protein